MYEKEHIKNDRLFDPKLLDSKQRSNIDRMKIGRAPIGKDGKPINLHHLNQKNSGGLWKFCKLFIKNIRKLIKIPGASPTGY